MFRVIGSITADHEFGLVILAVFLCLFAMFAATELMSRARAARAAAQRLWIAGTGFVAGSGIWATHFILLLAFHSDTPVSHDVALTGLSLLSAVVLSTAAFAVTIRWERPLSGGVVLATAIASMHFSVVFASLAGATMAWEPSFAVASVVIALMIAPLAMVGAGKADRSWKTAIIAGLLTLAVCAQHFVAITAVSLTPIAGATAHVALEPQVLTVAVAAIATLVAALALTAAMVDRHLVLRSVYEAQRLQAQFAEIRYAKRALENAQRTLSAYQAGLDSSAIVAITDAKGLITYANDRFCALSGFARDELTGQNHRILNSGTHPRSFFIDLWRRIGRGETFKAEICNRSKSGALYWVDTTIVPLIGAHGRPEGYISIRYDITDRVTAEAASAKRRVVGGLISNMQAEAISSGSIFLAISHAMEALLDLVSGRAAVLRQLGREDGRDALPGIFAQAVRLRSKCEPPAPKAEPAISLVDAAQLSDAQRQVVDDSLGNGSFFDNYTAGEVGAAEFVGMPLTAGGELFGVLALDISCLRSERYRSELGTIAAAIGELMRVQRENDRRSLAAATAENLARQDALTGLGNRRFLMDEFDGRIDHPLAQFALILIDLDRFKPINDTYGHLAGDQVLQIVAQRMRETIHGDCAIARLGGDEFALLTAPEGKAPGVRRLASRLLRVLSAPIAIDDIHVSVGASIGVAMYPNDASTAQELLHLADAAMYRAKKKRGEVQFYDISMDEHTRLKASLETDLRAAIEADEIVPFFQPVVALATGEVVGHELLARWQHKERGFVAPAEFIGIAEEAGLIDDLFWQLLRKACAAHTAARATTLLSVNLSAAQTKDPLFAQRLLKALTMHGFPVQRLEIEVTETAMISDVERARILLQSLRNLGVRIALDDFGTGYSSLVLLRDLPIDKVKIDQSFISGLRSEANATIVDAILGMAAALNLEVTAEGIEAAEVANRLKERGCQYGQGYLFGTPQPHLSVTSGELAAHGEHIWTERKAG